MAVVGHFHSVSNFSVIFNFSAKNARLSSLINKFCGHFNINNESLGREMNKKDSQEFEKDNGLGISQIRE